MAITFTGYANKLSPIIYPDSTARSGLKDIYRKQFYDCNDINWATWAAFTGQSATGIINDNSTSVSVTMTSNFTFSSTPGIYNHYLFNNYPSPVPDRTVPQTTWSAVGPGVTTMCFSQKVTNPVLLLASLGASDGTAAKLNFSLPYVVLYDGGGMTYNSNTSLTGIEGYAIIMFPGDFTCVTINSTTTEFYTNITWGLRPPPFEVNISEINACSSTTLEADGGVTYHWSGGDTPDQARNTFHQSGIYVVTVTNSSGCTTSTSKEIVVGAGLAVEIESSPTADCSVVTLTAKNGVSYIWDGGDTPNSATNTFHQSGTYTVKSINTEGCESTASTTITITAPTALITGNSAGCGDLTLVASGGVSYSWDGGDTPNSATNTFHQSGTYTVTVTGTNGCTGTASKTIVVNTPPIPLITGNATSCGTLTLIASGGVSYLWDGGDSPSSATNTFTTSGMYTVTVTGANGCIATASKTIVVNTPPTPLITGNNTGCGDLTLVASGGVSYSWDGGDTPGNASNTFHTSGTYTVTVTGAGGCTATIFKTIVVNVPPTAEITGNVTGCSTVTLTASGGISYLWDGGDTPSNATNTFRQSGLYTVTVTDANGCTATASRTIVVNTPPTAVITGSTAACGTLTLTASGGVSYLWDGGDTPSNATNTFTTSGTYTVTVTGADGCTATASKTIVVNVLPVAVITGNNTACGTLTLTASGGVSYLWSGGATPTSATNDFYVSGTYTVLVTGANGCTATTSKTIIVNQIFTPGVSIVSSVPGVICKDTEITFTATVEDAGPVPTYQWMKNDVIVSTDPVYTTKDLANNDKITCKLTSDAICPVPVVSDPIIIAIGEQPTIIFKKDYTIILPDAVELDPEVTGNIVSYTWEPAAGLSDATIRNPIANPVVTTTYHLKVISQTGCEAIANVTVTVLEPISIPNTFTPNGDGINDVWNISSLAYYKNAYIEIFNRHGDIVYRSYGYDKPWDGSFKGKQVPVGTYYYVINPKHKNLKVFTGQLTVLR